MVLCRQQLDAATDSMVNAPTRTAPRLFECRFQDHEPRSLDARLLGDVHQSYSAVPHGAAGSRRLAVTDSSKVSRDFVEGVTTASESEEHVRPPKPPDDGDGNGHSRR